MKQNKYDDNDFFSAYTSMPRSVKGLEGAGEWHAFQRLLPNLQNKQVLDLGCGLGWHCRYAREQLARSVTGVDLSSNMLQMAREMTDDSSITYIQSAMEDVAFPDRAFDVVISSLAFHYVASFERISEKVCRYLKEGGNFVFSVEHPMYTARNEQDWHYDEQGNRLHWPVDRYQAEGLRDTPFLTAHVTKYHRTMSTYINSLIRAGFRIDAIEEPMPSVEMLSKLPEMKDECRRPMFLIISARKS